MGDEDNISKTQEEIKELEDKLKNLRKTVTPPRLDLTKDPEHPGLLIGYRSNGRKFTVRENRDRFFFPKEWMKFYDIIKSKRQKYTFDFLINTGARIEEARGVQVKDIDIDNKRIILRKTKVKSKSGERNPRPRIIPISSKFAKRTKAYILLNRFKSEDHLNILSTPAANLALDEKLNKIGIEDWYMFSVHNIRKSLSVWLLALGIDSLALTAHMGHDIRTAARHYVSANVFSYEELKEIRLIIDDLYYKQKVNL